MNGPPIAELIYSRVESAFSPRRRSGYQTVYRSPELDEAAVQAIEERVQCFDAADPEVVRRQFFPLDDGRCAVTHTRTIAPHREIVDRNGRLGAFLAHCLVVTRAEFDRRHANPFVLLDHFDFLTDPEVMVQRYGPGRVPEPPAPPAVARAPEPDSSWSDAETRKLLYLARQAEPLVGAAGSVLLVGDQEEIVEALRLVFACLPANLRWACSFDTHIERCSVRPGRFWAVGAPRRQGGEFLLVDAAARTVDSPGPDEGSGSSLYFRWVDHVAGQQGQLLARYAPTAQALALAFEAGAPPEDVAGWDEDACRSFLDLHVDFIRRRVRALLEAALSPELATALAPVVEGGLGARALLEFAARPDAPAGRLSGLVADWVAAGPPVLSDPDWGRLRVLARGCGHWRLLHWSATLCRRPREAERDEALEQMDVPTYRAALALLGRPIAPRHFVAPAHVADLLAHPAVASAPDRDVVRLAGALAAAGVGERLGPLADRVAAMSAAALKALRRALGRGPIAPALAEALDVHDRRTAQVPSLWVRLFPPRVRPDAKE